MLPARPRTQLRPVVEVLVIAATLVISNRYTWLCVFEIHRPVYWCEYGSFSDELLVYFVLLVAVVALLVRSPLHGTWAAAWRENPALIGFTAWCVASVGWSVSPTHTVYRSLVALFATVVASYMGIRYGSAGWMRILVWFAAVTTVLSFLLVWFHPQAAVMSTSGLVGAWRGFSRRETFRRRSWPLVRACSHWLLLLRSAAGCPWR